MTPTIGRPGRRHAAREWLVILSGVLGCMVPHGARAGSASGAPCSDGSMCASAICVDGVCCDTLCDGLCERCDGVAAVPAGTCGLIPSGLDPQTECPEVGQCDTVCDGAGGCSVLQCPDGEPCTEDLSCVSGQCVDGFCCDSACSGTCVACNLVGVEGSCVPIPSGTDPQEDCPDSGGCVSTCAPFSACSEFCGNLGAPCSDLLECDTLLCVDSVCCNSACDGVCETCAESGLAGLCQPVPAGEDPAGDCPAVDGCVGGCDGLGACRRCSDAGGPCDSDGECRSSICSEGVCCDRLCDGVCQGCDVEGLVGVCSPEPDGTDPDGDCLSGVCDGTGGCRMSDDATVVLDASADAADVIPLTPGGCDCGCVVAASAVGARGSWWVGLASLLVIAAVRCRRAYWVKRRCSICTNGGEPAAKKKP